MSLFERVTRYPAGGDHNPRENRLTEVTAGVLERVPELAVDLARAWLKPQDRDTDGGAAWAPARAGLDEDGLQLRGLRTQRYTRSGWFVDLELRFGRRLAPSADDVVIWVEVKHGVDPHQDQLDHYLTDLAGLGVRAGAVVLLAPRASYPFTPPPPPEVPQRTWQDAGRTIAGWRPADPVDRFLCDELVAYLREEGLMDPEVITPVHLTALAERARAEQAVARACEIASGYLARKWNERADFRPTRQGGPERWGTGYWETYPQAPRGQTVADWSPAWFDWNLKEADWEMGDSRGGVPVFISGLCVDRGVPYIAGPEGAAWAAALADSHGFVSVTDDMDRFVRVAYPEEVLVGRTLQQQGENLGAWIAASYRALYEAGPPPRRQPGQASSEERAQ